MPVEEKIGLSGLLTNVAETQAPPGTLIEAENVVMRRPGCIEPRDGLQLAGSISSGFAAYGFSWRGKDFYARNVSNVFDWYDTAGGGPYQHSTPRDASASALTIDPQPFRRDTFSRAEARGNLYLPYDSGVLKKDAESGNWTMTGIPHAMRIEQLSLLTTTPTWLPNNEQVAYRAVLVRTDANGLKVSSLPTSALTVANTAGAARSVSLRITVSNKIEWDALELYRSRNFPTSARIDEEFQLVAVLDASQFSALAFADYIDHTDLVEVDARGVTLYTSPSRGGVNEQNNRPPAAALNALFRGSQFFANIRGPRRITVSGTWGGDLSAAADGIGFREYTGNQSVGSNQLTSMSSTVGLEKGMVVSVDLVPRTITAISGSTITLDGNALSNGTGVSYGFSDAIGIDGEWYALAVTATYGPAYVNHGLISVLQQEITPPEGGYGFTQAFESLLRDATSHTIQATHGSEYSPPLPDYDGTPLEMEQDVWPGGFAWSKPDEPEHVRPIDYGFMGDQNKATLGLVPTRDALFFLKEDGVFRLTGANGVWRVDPFDPTARCMLPGSVRAVRGRGVFLGDRGVAMVSDAGVEMISAPINDLVKPVIDQIQASWLSTGYYELPGMQGAHASCVFERESEYTLARGSTVAPLVYNDITGAWTTLAYYGHGSEEYAYAALFAFERAGKCVLSLTGTPFARYFTTLLSTDAGAEYLRYDRASAITVSSYAAPNATVSGGITALEDDIIKDSAGRYWRITADVSASSTVPVALAGGTAAMATGAATLYRALRCKVTATGFVQPISAQKQRGAFSTTWTKLVGPVRLRYGYQSSQSPAWVEEDAHTSLVQPALASGDGYADYELGVIPVAKTVPVASKRSWLMRARIRWAQAHGDAQLEGIHCEVLPLPPGAPQQVNL